jgi:hypothetical protein
MIEAITSIISVIIIDLFREKKVVSPEHYEFIARMPSEIAISESPSTVNQWKGDICGRRSYRWELSHLPVEFSEPR